MDPGYADHKDAVQKRLRRIEGQVRGLQRMVDEDQYCIDVLTQVSATTKALQAVALELLEDHLGHCVARAIETGGPEASAKVREATAAIERLVRSWWTRSGEVSPTASECSGRRCGRSCSGSRCPASCRPSSPARRCSARSATVGRRRSERPASSG